MKTKQLLLCSFVLIFGCTPNHQKENLFDPLTYVDPFIGTGFHGHTFPGATVPFGMVQLSPDTHIMGWDASSGYHYEDSTIYGFSHTHLSGTGIGDLGEILLLPYSNTDDIKPVATFLKSDESASPGYYKVRLDNYDVTAELTATRRVGLHRYSFENGKERKVMLDLGHVLQPNWGHSVIDNTIRKIDDKTFEGVHKTRGWANDHLIAYRLEFAEPFTGLTSYLEGEIVEQKEINGKDIKLHFTFSESDKPYWQK